MAKYARRRSYKRKRSFKKRTYKRRPSFKRRAARPTDGIVSRKISLIYQLTANAGTPDLTPFRVFWGLSATDVSAVPGNIALTIQEEHLQFTALFTRFRVKGVRVELRVP